jgi:hypothetical protein
LHEFDDAEEIAAMRPEDRPGCPKGHLGVTFDQHLTSQLNVVGSTVADAAPEALRWVFDNDDVQLRVTESAFIEKKGVDGSEGIRVERGGDDSRSSSADLTATGRLDDRVSGKASPKVLRELRVADLLVERLNRDGGQWRQPRRLDASAKDERGVDCEASDPSGKILSIQVTSVERELWRQLSRDPEVARTSPTIDDVVDAVGWAIARKGRVDGRGKITLAIDGTDSTAPSLRTVVLTFRQRHGRWARDEGHEAVWVVGPTVDLVNRLDVAE